MSHAIIASKNRLIGIEDFVTNRHWGFLDWKVEIKFDLHSFSFLTIIHRCKDFSIETFNLWRVLIKLFFSNKNHWWRYDNFCFLD